MHKDAISRWLCYDRQKLWLRRWKKPSPRSAKLGPSSVVNLVCSLTEPQAAHACTREASKVLCQAGEYLGQPRHRRASARHGGDPGSRDQTQLTCQRAGTNSKQKDREAAKKAIESALAQFESDPFEARKAVC